MSELRKRVENLIIRRAEEICPKHGNKEYYKEKFAAMSDRQFDQYMKSLRDGATITILSPNGKEGGLVMENLLELLEKYKRKVFERIWMPDGEGGRYLTPKEYPVITLPLRRQTQSQSKKIGVAENNRHRDALSGQVTGPSKASRTSYPQLQMIFSQINNPDGKNWSLNEFINIRGGNKKGMEELERQIAETGEVDLESFADKGEAQIIQIIRNRLKAMHLANTL